MSASLFRVIAFGSPVAKQIIYTYLLYEYFLCQSYFRPYTIWRVWRYQRGNQNAYIEEEQKTQWSKEKVQKDKQRSTKHTHKTKDRVTRTPLKTGDELRCSWSVSSSVSTNGTRRANLVTNPVDKSWMRKGKWLLQLNQEEPLVQ
jgi:hypothetical protein